MQKLTSKAKVVFVNCMSVRQSQGIYTKILTEVTGRDQGKLSAKEAARKLQKLLTTSGPMVLDSLLKIIQCVIENVYVHVLSSVSLSIV